MYFTNFHNKRFQKTLDFLNQHIDEGSQILDLGVQNPLSELMKAYGYKVQNTQGEDLDENQMVLVNSKAEVVTAFEILENIIPAGCFCCSTELIHKIYDYFNIF